MRERLMGFANEQSGGLKLLLIAGLTLALLIPLGMAEDLVYERLDRHQEVLRDIGRLHGREQTLVGPLIVVPYVEETTQTIGDDATDAVRTRTFRRNKMAAVLPEKAGLSATLLHDVRRRGVYEAPVYSADIAVEGAFVRPDLKAVIPNVAEVDWSKAALAFWIGDLAGLAEAQPLATPGGEGVAFASGPPAYAADMFRRGADTTPDGYGDRRAGGVIHASFQAPELGGGRMAFSTSLRLNGSGGLRLAPVAGESRLKIAGDWPHPSFQGAPAPTTREVTESGFSADWTIPALARGYGSVWFDKSAAVLVADAAANGVGFRHARPDDFYVATLRAAKYGVLFVALTFIACFVLERFGGRKLHGAQYGLVGLSLALFYVLLLALAERLGLSVAYGLAALVIVGLNGAYIGAALRSLRQGAAAATALGLLYAAFYVMLASEDDSLLIGSGLLLAGLALAMAATTRLNAGESKDVAAP